MQDFIRNPSSLNINDLMPQRPIIGDNVPVILWRLIRVIGMHQILGEEAADASYFVGKKIGKLIEANSVDEFIKKLSELKIGRLEVMFNTNESFHLAIGECITCAGISPSLGKSICQLEVGIVAGALENIYKGKKVIGEETKCIGGLGDDVCLVECQII